MHQKSRRKEGITRELLMRFCCRTEFAFQNRLSTDITIFLAILQGRSLRCLLDLEQMRLQAVVPRNPPVLEYVEQVHQTRIF